jgi:glycosyltransferase involved in cell wall biosynthesis
MSEPKVSAIICCYTEERLKDIHEAVDSVLTQTLRPHELIIAVDHNRQLYDRLAQTYGDSVEPRGTSLNLSQSPGSQCRLPDSAAPIPVVIVLNEGAQGLSETRNVGVRAASGDVVAFLDDDAVAEKDWLLYLTRPFLNERVVAVGGRAIPLWLNGKRPSWFPEELDWIVGCTYKGLPLNGNEMRNVPGCNMAFRRGVFEHVESFRSDIGGLKETPRGGEEAELCLRISRAMPEALIIYQAQAAINHKVTPRRTTWRYLWQRSHNEGYYKSVVKRLCSGSSPRALSTEGFYLRHLLSRSSPGRLARFYHKGNLVQAGAIFVCIAATGAGYLVGGATTRPKRKNARRFGSGQRLNLKDNP